MKHTHGVLVRSTEARSCKIHLRHISICHADTAHADRSRHMLTKPCTLHTHLHCLRLWQLRVSKACRIHVHAGQGLMQLLVIGAYSYWMLPGANGLSLSYCRKWMGPASTPRQLTTPQSFWQLKSSCNPQLHKPQSIRMQGQCVQ